MKKKTSSEISSGLRVEWAWRHPSGLDGVLEITDAGKPSYYYLQIISSSRFMVTKVEADRRTTYDLVSIPGVRDNCGCEAGTRGRECRHVKAIKELRDRGIL